MSSVHNFPSDIPSFEQLQIDLLQALSEWQQPTREHSPLAGLFLLRSTLQRYGCTVHGATNQLLVDTLAKLAIEHSNHANVLQSRYLDNEKVEHGANRLNISSATFHRRRAEAIPLLATTVLEMERAARSAHRTQLTGRLEQPSYTTLFGKEAQLQSVEAQLLAQSPPWLVVITGIGGIGKTTLADALARRMIESCAFNDIGWVTARQNLFNAGGSIAPLPHPKLTTPALIEGLSMQFFGNHFGQRSYEEVLAAVTDRLKSSPHLVVIDNLESLRDLELLLPALRQLVNPSKILMTTRDSLFTEPDLYHAIMAELDEPDALALVRQEAQMRNIAEVAAASDAELHPIYETVGGNPLALRLVTGQLRIHSLDALLSDLMEARGSSVEALYDFIYRRAWSMLDEAARDVLVAMPLVRESGGRFEMLAATCGLSDYELRKALHTLVTLNLVDVRGDLQARRYLIHGLTRAFLHEQVIRWQEVE